jgi:hypothetical protein
MRSVEKIKILEKKRGPYLKAKRNFSLVLNYEEKKTQPGPSNYYPFVSLNYPLFNLKLGRNQRSRNLKNRKTNMATRT